MREKWKRVWARRPRLSRGQKTVRNFLLCVPILIWFWGLAGCPLPTAELELRRWERTHLLEPGQIVFAGREDERVALGEDRTVQLNRGLLVSAGERWAVIGEDQTFRKVALEDAPTAAGVWTSILVDFSGEAPEFCTPVLVFGVPEGAASGDLTVEAKFGVALTGSGSPVAEGVWLFAPSTTAEQWSLDTSAPCTMRLRREDGSLLLEWEGTLR